MAAIKQLQAVIFFQQQHTCMIKKNIRIKPYSSTQLSQQTLYHADRLTLVTAAKQIKMIQYMI